MKPTLRVLLTEGGRGEKEDNTMACLKSVWGGGGEIAGISAFNGHLFHAHRDLHRYVLQRLCDHTTHRLCRV